MSKARIHQCDAHMFWYSGDECPKCRREEREARQIRDAFRMEEALFEGTTSLEGFPVNRHGIPVAE